MMKQTIMITAAIVVLVAVSGCALYSDNLVKVDANVEDIDIVLLESFPLQARVIARGSFSDSCTRVAEIETLSGSYGFNITVRTARPADAQCAQVITPFEETIPLDIRGFAACNYTVTVNGVSETFELQVDNVLQTTE